MDDRDDELVVAVEQLSRVQNRSDFQVSDGAQGDSGDTETRSSPDPTGVAWGSLSNCK